MSDKNSKIDENLSEKSEKEQNEEEELQTEKTATETPPTIGQSLPSKFR